MSSKPDVRSGVEELGRKPEEHQRVKPSEVDKSSILPDGSKRSRSSTTIINVVGDKAKEQKVPEISYDISTSALNTPARSRKASDASTDSGGSRKSAASAQDAGPSHDLLIQIASSMQAMQQEMATTNRSLASTQQELAVLKAGRKAESEARDVNNILSHGQPTPRQEAKVESRQEAMARALENSNLATEIKSTLLSTLGHTSYKVPPSTRTRDQSSPSFPFIPLGESVDTLEGIKALHVARHSSAPWVTQLGQQVVQEQALKRSRDDTSKKLKAALSSYDALYKFLLEQGLFTAPHYETYTNLLHQVKQLELSAGWPLAKLYVDWLIDYDNKYRDNRSLREKVGPTPADGNFIGSLDRLGLLQAQLSLSKQGHRGRDTSTRKAAGSPNKDDKHKYFCKHHGLWYTNPGHTTETCRNKGKNSPNVGPASQNGGAGSD